MPAGVSLGDTVLVALRAPGNLVSEVRGTVSLAVGTLLTVTLTAVPASLRKYMKVGQLVAFPFSSIQFVVVENDV